jgi:hypothetical protein
VRNQTRRLDKTEEKSVQDGEKVVWLCRLILFKQYERHGAVYRLSDRTYGSISLTEFVMVSQKWSTKSNKLKDYYIVYAK